MVFYKVDLLDKSSLEGVFEKVCSHKVLSNIFKQFCTHTIRVCSAIYNLSILFLL